MTWITIVFDYIIDLFINQPIISYTILAITILLLTELSYYRLIKDEPFNKKEDNLFLYVISNKSISIVFVCFTLIIVPTIITFLSEMFYSLLLSTIKYKILMFKTFGYILISLIILYPYYKFNKKLALKYQKKYVKKVKGKRK